MRTIYKYELAIVDRLSVDMPEGAVVLSVQTQHEALCVWAIVDPDRSTARYHFRIVGTGYPADDLARENLSYVGTAQMAGGNLVWHVFTDAPVRTQA